MKIKIEDLSHIGEGVGRIDNKVTFVPGLLPTELAKVKILEEEKKFQKGELIEILEESEDRIESECEFFGECGGCSLQNLKYEAQVKLKEKRVKNLLEKEKLSFKMKDMIPMKKYKEYRNFLQLHRGKKGFGFNKRGSHEVLAIDDCLIQDPLLRKIIKKISKLDLDNGIKGVEIRSNGEEALFFWRGKDLRKKDLPLKKFKNHIHAYETKGRIHFANEKDFFIELNGIKYSQYPQTFFQVNTLMAEKLFKDVMDILSKEKDVKIIDLYCGMGAITIPAAKYGKEVIGIEINQNSVEMAKKNAAAHGIDNIRFISSPVEAIGDLLQEEKGDIIIIDPPRSGLSSSARKMIRKALPKKIIYISCDPATLARDLKYFTKKGYGNIEIQSYDFFPYTNHIESLAVLERI